MSWFNWYGLIFVVIIMIPNIIFAVKNKEGFANVYKNKAAEICEQVGRYACMALMVFNIPYTWIGFYFAYAKVVYLAVNGFLVAAYCVAWAVLWKKSGIVKALLLSVLPSLVFLFSSIMIGSIPLALFAIIFAATHVLISVKNALPCEASAKVAKKSFITVCSIILCLVLAVVGSLGGLTIYGQSNTAKLENMSALDMINYAVSDKQTKISVAIVENGQVSYRVFGSAGEESALYDYEIGSVSKTFVGLLCAKAVSEGKLKLTDSISKYLPLDGEKYYPTVERLLTHTSGYDGYYFESQMIGNKLAHTTNDFYGISKEKILQRVKSVELQNKDYPFVYSNFGISVVGLVLEKVYNDDFTGLMNGFIRTELNLTNTQAAKQSGNLDKYWKWKAEDGYLPAGAIISNIQDMASYLNLYLTDKLSYSAQTCAKIKQIDANNAAFEKVNVRLDGIGMTWILDEKNGIVWHDGATTDFNSYMGFSADKTRGVVILSNLNANDKISMTVIGAKILAEKVSL